MSVTKYCDLCGEDSRSEFDPYYENAYNWHPKKWRSIIVCVADEREEKRQFDICGKCTERIANLIPIMEKSNEKTELVKALKYAFIDTRKI